MGSVALIAHDGQKQAMVALARRWGARLRDCDLVCTHTTGSLIEREAGLNVSKVLSGPMGGDLQIGAMVATGSVRAVVFLRDPLTAHPHEPDIAALMKVCDTHNVPLATNVATAELILEHLEPDGASETPAQ